MSLEVQQISKETSVNKKRREALEAKRDNTAVAIPLTVQSTRRKSVDLSCDGEFSVSEAAKNFGKGLVSPITGMFESKKSFWTGVAVMAGCAALVVATGGAAAPFLVGAGVAMGSVQAGKGIYKIATAKDGDDIEKACYDFGSATGTIGLSVLGAKGSLKQAGVATEGLNPFSSTVKCFTTAKSTATESAMTFKTGYWKTNVAGKFKSFFQSKKFKKITNDLHKRGQENYDQNFKDIQDMFPEDLRSELTGRLKGKTSLYDKTIKYFSAKNKIKAVKKNASLTSEQKANRISDLKQEEKAIFKIPRIAESKAADIIGTRINLKDTSPAQMERLTVSIIEAIKNDKIEIDVIRNYRGPKSESYFSKSQIKRIQSAANDKGQRAFCLEGKHQVRASGYCATQFKLIHKNGTFSELQIRGQLVDKVSSWEHIPYDLRNAKDLSAGNNKIGLLLYPFKKAIQKLSPEQYAQYEKYLVKNYKYARGQEQGHGIIEAKLPQGLDEILSAQNLEILSKKIKAISPKVDTKFSLLPELAFTLGAESLTNNSLQN